ncbi:two-component system, NarL family, sensor histidine kinase NreB [Bhargavaea beijingensis]|uniref:Sensor histidine kinase n=2 Tax=Bhargavaea beijingensis TaxID=426756 RepID=A0A1G6XC81_9BACL|nr:two-component system, NarL family, sensor histidine kinase NreB [Bhargavaea beijingensis]
MSVKQDLLNELMLKMFDKSSEAILFFDGEGRALAANPAAEKILDRDVLRALLDGKEGALCRACAGYVDESGQVTCENCYFHHPERSDFTSFQLYLNTKGQGLVPYASSFHTVDAENDIRVFMLRDMTRQQRMQEKAYQNKMMKHIIDAQENERRRISRELHDGVAQELMSAVVDLRVLKYMTGDADVLAKVKETEASLSRLLEDIRNLSVELRPAALDDLGLDAAFRSHFKRLEEMFGLLVDYTSDLPVKRYENEIETVVYRVCQEAILNAIKYADVDTVSVTLKGEGSRLLLTVRDSGTGFTPGDQPQGTGLGLYGMKERAELVGGTLEVEAAPGAGTTIRLSVPALPRREAR